MTTLLRVVSIASALGLAVLARAADSAAPFRPLSLEAALKVAAAEQKIVLIDFFTTWCEPCKRLDRETWSDTAVQAQLAKSAVALKLDAEKEGRGAATRYKIEAYPTILLLKPDGTVIDRIVGFLEPARFTTAYTLALEGKTARTRALAVVEATTGKLDVAAVQARLELARTLAREGDHAGALKEFLWCYDEGMVKVPSFTGVRTSFLLGDLARLAQKYPPARAALVERRDAAEQRLRAGDLAPGTGTEFAALCLELGEEARLIATFDALPPGSPVRQALGFRLFRVLLARQRYADALTVQPHATLVRMIDIMTRPAANVPATAIDARQRSAIASMLDAIEVLAGAGDVAHADEIVARLKAFDPTEETTRAIEQRLKRAKEVSPARS